MPAPTINPEFGHTAETMVALAFKALLVADTDLQAWIAATPGTGVLDFESEDMLRAASLRAPIVPVIIDGSLQERKGSGDLVNLRTRLLTGLITAPLDNAGVGNEYLRARVIGRLKTLAVGDPFNPGVLKFDPGTGQVSVTDALLAISRVPQPVPLAGGSLIFTRVLIEYQSLVVETTGELAP